MKIESENFNVSETNLMGKGTGEQISSYHFIMESGKRLIEYSKTDSDKFPALLHEYSGILKQLIKYEMLEEMRNRIDNIDTFYR